PAGPPPTTPRRSPGWSPGRCAPPPPPVRWPRSPTPRNQLVPRVVHDAPTLAGRHQPAGPQPPARLDAVDLAPTEPDQRHDVGAVEQLGLERGRAGPRLERHGADGAGDHGAAPVGALPDGGRAELLGTFLELLGLQRLLGGEQA